MRLFLSDGFDATTVDMIAAAADVSSMTCYRYFPTKEDLVLSDEYDPLIAQMIEAEPSTLKPVQRIRNGVLKAFERVWQQDRDLILARSRLLMETPQLRARQWEQQSATVKVLTRSLETENRTAGLRLTVIASACLSTMTAAVEYWTDHCDEVELPDLMRDCFETLQDELH